MTNEGDPTRAPESGGQLLDPFGHNWSIASKING